MSRTINTVIAILYILFITSATFANWKDDSKAIDISGGEDHTLVLTANKWSWSSGHNGWYQLGIGDTTESQKTLVRVLGGAMNTPGLQDINDVDAGWKHSLALENYNPCDPNYMGFVWAWGDDEWAQLGNGPSGTSGTPVQVLRGEQTPEDPNNPDPNLARIIEISAGRSGEHSLAVDVNGYAYAWGRNQEGQCGNAESGTGLKEDVPVHVWRGEQEPEDPCNPDPNLTRIVAVSAGEWHSMALEAYDPYDPNMDGRVYTWGDDDFVLNNGSGVLGIGDSAGDRDTPVCVRRGQQDYNEPNQIYLRHIVAISAGWDHSMALEKYDVNDPFLPDFDPNHKGRVYTWGNNGQGWGDDGNYYKSNGGRLGNGSATDGNSTPVLVLRGEQPAEDPNDPYPYLSRIMGVSAGEAHSMALDVNGCVYTWGDNQHGQLGDGTNEQRLVPVRVVGHDRNRNGIHDANEGYLENIVAIAAGYWHSLAIDANGTIWTWGKGSAGRLGLGNKTIDCNTPHPIPVVYNITQERFYFGIQTAIDDANDVGDTLEASPGTYYENVEVFDTNITLESMDPNNGDVVAATVIDAHYNNDYSYTVDFESGSDCTFAGFTLTNGNYEALHCGGSSSVNITDCRIENNAGWVAIRINASSANIANSRIQNNSSPIYSVYGIYCENGSTVSITDCNIAWNTAEGVYSQYSALAVTDSAIHDNGFYGIHAQYNYDTAIERSLIEGNGNSGVYAHDGGDFVLNGSVVRDNGWDGVDLEDNSSETLTNNWIHNNGTAGESYGCGIWFENYQSATPLVRNNTICGNPTYGIEVGVPEFTDPNYTDPNILNCIVYGNAGGDLHRPSGTFASVNYCCLQNSHSGTGNIVVDPCFIDADANDFHLDANSPCIDKGDPAFVAEPNETDIDGENRVEDGDANGTIIVDMGADEFYWSPADLSGDGIVNFIDYAMLTSYWQDAGVDYNDVFLDGDVNSVGLAEFCDDWLREAGSLTGSMPLMAGRGGAGMVEGLGLDAGLSAVASAEREPAVAEPVDIEAIMKWLAEIWLDPEVREQIDAEDWLKLYESLKDLEPTTK